MEEEDIVSEIDQADAFKEDIYTTLVKIDKVIPTTAATATLPVRERTPGGEEPHVTQCVRLLKLTIKPFGGEMTQWTSFWDSFEAAIHCNPKLSDIDKFNYLWSLLEHSAREAISGLTLSAANYQ